MKNSLERPLHLLLLARYFPPGADVAGRRAQRFARGLSQAGLRVTVLTVEERFHAKLDPSLLGEGDQQYEILRTSTYAPITGLWGRRAGRGGWASKPAPTAEGGGGPRKRGTWSGAATRVAGTATRLVLRPDENLGWFPHAMAAARRLHARAPVDVVMTSMPPYSTLLAAERIARLTKARLVADYRDPWASDRETSGNLIAPQRRFEAWLERRLLHRVDLALFTSETARVFYREAFPFLRAAEVLPNSIDRYIPPTGEPIRAPLTWIHAGSTYGGKRSLAPVLHAMAKLRDTVPARLVMIGEEPTAELALSESLGIRDRIDWRGRLPLEETLAELRRAHRLVAVIAPEHPLSVPAKIFDYLSTSRPMLLLSTPGHAATRFLEGVDEHRCIAPDETDRIAELLRTDQRAIEAGGIPDVPRSTSARFESEFQIRRLAELLSELRLRQATT